MGERQACFAYWLVAPMSLVQPKKPVGGAFGAFATEKRPEFTKACAGQQASVVTKMAAAAWAKLNEAQKAPYQKEYENAKAKYEKDTASFLAAGGVKEKGLAAQRKDRKLEKEGGKRKKEKDPNAPKKPVGGGYGVFLVENRDKISKGLPTGYRASDVAKAAGEQWRNLSDAAKKPYEAKFQTKSAEYKAAMAEYKKAHGNEDGCEDEDDEDESPEEEVGKPAPKKVRKAGA